MPFLCCGSVAEDIDQKREMFRFVRPVLTSSKKSGAARHPCIIKQAVHQSLNRLDGSIDLLNTAFCDTNTNNGAMCDSCP